MTPLSVKQLPNSVEKQMLVYAYKNRFVDFFYGLIFQMYSMLIRSNTVCVYIYIYIYILCLTVIRQSSMHDIGKLNPMLHIQCMYSRSVSLCKNLKSKIVKPLLWCILMKGSIIHLNLICATTSNKCITLFEKLCRS